MRACAGASKGPCVHLCARVPNTLSILVRSHLDQVGHLDVEIGVVPARGFIGVRDSRLHAQCVVAAQQWPPFAPSPCVCSRLHYELRELCENLPDEALLLSAQTVAIVSLPACEMAQYAPRLGLASGEGLKAAAKLCLTKLNQCSRRRSAFIRNEQTGGTGGIVDQNSLCHPPRLEPSFLV
jgi:hypothetical protein